MSLLLTGDKDQALLAMLIQDASKVAGEKGNFLGRTAIQKMMYFLKALDVPMRYRFDIHRYGPYCDEIIRDVELLIVDEVIVDRSSDRLKYSNYEPGKAIAEILSKHRARLDAFSDKIRAVARTFTPMRPEKMELLSTLHYLYRRLRASTEKGPWKNKVISHFLDIKGGRFNREEVDEAYDAMVNAGIVEQ